MTQRNPNPTPNTGSLAGWSTIGTATTLTSTTDGARWVGGSSGTGRGIRIRIKVTSAWSNQAMQLSGITIRRNSGTADITAIDIDSYRWQQQDISPYYTDLTGGQKTMAPEIFLPLGTWIRLPTYLAPSAPSLIWPGYSLSVPAPLHNGSTSDDYYDIWILASDNKPFNFTIKGVGLYDGGAYTNNQHLDAGDAAWTLNQVSNSMTASGVWAKTPDEPVKTLAWNWGDGSAVETGSALSASYQSRSHTYTSPGVYTVTLTASSADSNAASGMGGNPYSVAKQVTVPAGTFEAHYSYETDWLTVAVDASSSIAPSLSPIDTYAWDWGDGNTTPANPSKLASHTYAAPGGYNITLTVVDTATGRTSTETKTVTVVSPPSVTLSFTAAKNLLQVAFIPSKLDGASYAWDFGDGNTSTTVQPTHTYSSPGTYSVTLTVDALAPVTQPVTVSDVYTPLGSLMDALRLEVAIPKTGVHNLIGNPSGALGAWGWWTSATNSYLTGSTSGDQPADKGILGAKLIFRSGGSGDQWIRSATVRAVAGQYAAVQVNVPYVDGYYRIGLDALNAAGTVIGSSALSGYQTAHATNVVRSGPYLLPAGTVAARLTIIHTSNTSTGVPAANKLLIFRRAALFTAATSAELTTIPYSEGQDWQDLIGPTSEISISRAALNLGTLSATILDSTFDPATSGTIRPGQPCRLQAMTPDEAGNVRWSPIFTGQVGDPQVEYVPAKGTEDSPKLTRIKLAAYDAARPLTKWKRAEGVAKIKELPEILEGVPVPYEINGSSGQVPSASIVNANDNASVLDQIAITRDSDGGYAFVSRAGVLVAREPEFMPTVPVGVIDEAVYSDIDAGFNLADTINSVSIKWLRYTAAAGADPAKVEEVVYGPYDDNPSIDEWGLRPATFTMLGVENPTAIATRAGEILTANAQPARMITAVTVPIRFLEDLSADKALIDLYDLVQLGYARTETDEQIRVTSIKHTITPQSWSMDLGFSADGAVASPQLVAAPPITMPTPAGLPHGEAIGQSNATPQTITTATLTKVTTAVLTQVTVQGGITWSAANNRFTVAKAGVYLLHGRVAWQANGAGTRLIYLYKNGVNQMNFATPPPSATAMGQAITAPLALAAGDYIELFCYQSSGGNLTLINNAGNCGLTITYQGA